MIAPAYRAQVDLLLRLLPYVAEETVFALKGGTAINMFVRNMPRLSVDIDLTYLPFDPRPIALQQIAQALARIKARAESAIAGSRINLPAQTDGQEVKLFCQLGQAQVKIEVNTTLRGQVQPVRLLQVAEAVQEEFGKFAAIQVVSHAELFGGKICAALDRQHPRDLFDVHFLLEEEGFSEDVKLGFITSLVSHPRPIHELIAPNLLDQRTVLETQFAGMTARPFSYTDFEATRRRLIQEIQTHLTKADQAFLLSFKQGAPEWRLLALENLKEMPAVQWKLSNIQKLIQSNPEKHKQQLLKLADTFSR